MFFLSCGAESTEGASNRQQRARSPKKGAPLGGFAKAIPPKWRRWLLPAVLVAVVVLLAIVAIVLIVVLTRGAPARIAFLDRDSNIATMLPDGSDVQVLTDDGKDAGYAGLHWSPDHRWLAAMRMEQGNTGLWLASTGAKEGDTVAIEQGLPMAMLWSPGSQHVAVMTQDGSTWYVVIVDVPGEEQRSVELDVAPVPGLAWSRDSRRVATVGQDSDDVSRLLIVDAREGKAESVAEEDETVFSSVTWMPDGRRLAVTIRDRNGLETLYTILPDGSNLQEMSLEEADDIVTSLMFSTNGARMAYVIGAKSGGKRSLYVARPDGTEASLVAKASQIAPAEWSPDGSRLLFFNADKGGYRLYDVGKKDDTTVSGKESDKKQYSFCVFSPDGQRLVCQSGDRIYRCDFTAGKTSSLVRGSNPDW